MVPYAKKRSGNAGLLVHVPRHVQITVSNFNVCINVFTPLVPEKLAPLSKVTRTDSNGSYDEARDEGILPPPEYVHGDMINRKYRVYFGEYCCVFYSNKG